MRGKARRRAEPAAETNRDVPSYFEFARALAVISELKKAVLSEKGIHLQIIRAEFEREVFANGETLPWLFLYFNDEASAQAVGAINGRMKVGLIGEVGWLSRQTREEMGAVAVNVFPEMRGVFPQFFDDTYVTGYDGEVDIAATLGPAAEILGLTAAELQEAAHQYKAAKAEATERETTGRAKAKPRPDRSPEMVAAMLRDSILGRLHEKFQKQLREIALPEGGFTTIAQARAGSNLATTFQRLQKRREKLGLPPIEKPDRVGDAARMATHYYDHHTKTGELIPPKPRGRPRKARGVQPERPPAP